MDKKGLAATYNDEFSPRNMTKKESDEYERNLASLFSEPIFTKAQMQDVQDKLDNAIEQIKQLENRNEKLKLLESICADDMVRWNDDLQIYEIRE